MRDIQAELARCDAELAEHEALLRLGHEDMEGLLAAIRDWAYERRLIQTEIEGAQ